MSGDPRGDNLSAVDFATSMGRECSAIVGTADASLRCGQGDGLSTLASSPFQSFRLLSHLAHVLTARLPAFMHTV
jgi:hypothetical protein